jgi:outer membrane protein TolC
LKIFIQFSLAAFLALASYAGDGNVSLDSLVADAFARNPEINAYRAEIVAAKGVRRTAGEWRNPELTTDLGAKVVRDFDGNSRGNGALWTVAVSQTFEYPGRIALRKAIANRQIALAELGLEGFKTALASRVRSVAYRMALSEAKAKAANEVSNRFDELLSILSQRPAAASGLEVDVDSHCERVAGNGALTQLRHPHARDGAGATGIQGEPGAERALAGNPDRAIRSQRTRRHK